MCCALPSAHADRLLIDAWNPTLCPKLGLQGLFGESAFLSLCVHDYRPGAIEQLIRGSPYRVPNADNSGWHNPEGY